MRDVLRRAFCDGDAFLCLHVPPRWSPGGSRQLFRASRPGVLWHQEQVTLVPSPRGVLLAPATRNNSSSGGFLSFRISVFLMDTRFPIGHCHYAHERRRASI